MSVQVSVLVPKNVFTASVNAVEKNPCPDGYSGWFTVSRGVQVGSGSVSGLPSVSARGSAVRDRHNREKYFASSPAIPASATEQWTIANSRAVSRTLRPREIASPMRLPFQHTCAYSQH